MNCKNSKDIMNNTKSNFSYQYLKKLQNSVSKKYKITFVSAILCGLMAHIYQFTNKLFNYDELHAIPAALGEGFGYGRWMQEFIYRFIKHFWGNYSLPVINGLVTLTIFSISACFIIYILDINNEVFAFIIGGVCTTFPTVTCSYFYMYMSYYFALSMLLSVLSVVVAIKYKKNTGIIMASCLLACSIGIYQSYFSVAVSLTVLYLVVFSFTNNAERIYDIKKYIKLAVRFLIYLVSGLLLYIAVNKVILFITKEKMVEYQGISDMGKLNIIYIIKQFANSYFYYFRMFYADMYQTNPTSIIKVGILLLNVFAFILMMVVIIKKREHCYNIFSLLCLLLTPISIFILFAMTNENTYHYTLMMYSLVFVIILPMTIIEKSGVTILDSNINSTKLVRVIDYLSCIVGTLIIMNYIWFANGNYQALQYTNYHDLKYYSVMVTQIKSMDGYRDDIPIAIIGDEITDMSNTAGSLMGNTFNIGGKSESNINAWSYYEIIRRYLGFSQEFLWDDETKELLQNDIRVKSMPCYPQDGSIQFIDNTIVVKISE